MSRRTTVAAGPKIGNARPRSPDAERPDALHSAARARGSLWRGGPVGGEGRPRHLLRQLGLQRPPARCRGDVPRPRAPRPQRAPAMASAHVRAPALDDRRPLLLLLPLGLRASADSVRRGPVLPGLLSNRIRRSGAAASLPDEDPEGQ